jgi:4-amino-4-deoxychorismate lyase
VFETMRFRQGKIDFLHLHLERLQQGISRLGLPVEISRITGDLQVLNEQVSARTISDAVIRLTVTRGAGTRGYNPASATSASVILQVYPYDPRTVLQWVGVDLTICRMRLADQPALAGIKHLNRIENVLARAEWSHEFHEGLMLSQQGDVVEGTMSNVFFVEGSAESGWVLHTPPIERCGVSGIMRRLVLQDVASRLGITVLESAITQQQCMQFSAGFLTNAIIGIWPIKSLCGRSFGIVSVIRDIQQAVEVCREAI